jgi:cellulose synthase/poly-beta-1,6-N-acetylglucosamine synthase-like glycosyltransferase
VDNFALGTPVEETLLIVGAIGILGMTWLFPLLGRACWKADRLKADGGVAGSATRLRKVRIIIPAHNEERSIGATLQSLQRAIRYAAIYYPEVSTSILVGADGCTDRTAMIARNRGVGVVEVADQRGKWSTLLELVEASADADWVIFADCGVVWQQDFLARMFAYCADPQVIGIAPCYSNPRGGILERIHWRIERHLKKLESLAGGPVSIHGATVMYRRYELLETVRGLPALNWLNDDVVVPLALRTVHPDGRILYLENLGVSERPALSLKAAEDARELGRRKRMVMGNVQWIRRLFFAASRRNLVVGTLALRRIFRIFWAYWFVFLIAAGAGFLLRSGEVELTVKLALFALPASLSLMIPSLRRLLAAGMASLMAPIFLISDYQFERAVWK